MSFKDLIESKIEEKLKSSLDTVNEMKGATAGLRKSKTFPLRMEKEAEAFAKKHGGKVEKKGTTLYVTYDLPEEVELDENYEGNKQDFKYEVEKLLSDAGFNPSKTLKGLRKKGKKFEVDLSVYFDKDAFEHIAKETGAKLLSFKKGRSITMGIFEEVEKVEEANKNDPLVVVYNKRGGAETHAKLSTVAKIHGKDYSGHLDKLHKGQKVSIDGGRTLSLSTHNEEVELEEGTKTFKSLEDWLMACFEAGGTITKSGNTLRCMGLGRTQSATWDLKKGRGSMVESVELDEANLEEKKLDPVGKADADIDNDGDVDSSDEYLHNRRKAIKKAINKDKNEDKKQFMYAAKQAKEKGDKEFVFAGKKYNVEDIDIDEGSCGTMNASKIKSMAKKKKLAASYK